MKLAPNCVINSEANILDLNTAVVKLLKVVNISHGLLIVTAAPVTDQDAVTVAVIRSTNSCQLQLFGIVSSLIRELLPRDYKIISIGDIK